jgi:hypothetical protein
MQPHHKSPSWDICIRDIDGNNPLVIERAYSRDEIPISTRNIPRPEDLKKIPSLKEFARLVHPFVEGVDVGLLIGLDCPKALEPLEVISSENGTFACRLRHGWTINGPNPKGSFSNSTGSFRINIQVAPTPEIMNDFDNDEQYPGEKGMSREDRLFLAKVEANTSFENGHYSIGLPFREKNPTLPNNEVQAFQRAKSLQGRLERDTEYKAEYTDFMEGLLKKGFAEPVLENDGRGNGKVWYLPHHGVRHPQKKKLRVVFDCSVVFQNCSLNSSLLQGPNLTNSIVGVLTRFREGQVCFVGDIEQMFYQVKVPEEDRDWFRFLWWPQGDTRKPMEKYRMTVHLFGASSSPSVCNYALRRITTDFECSRETAQTIERNFYVDDCLRSTYSVDQAKELIKEVGTACSKGGFHLRKLLSNSFPVLEEVPRSEWSISEFQSTTNLVERTLGLKWNVEKDAFTFSFTLKEKPATRRGILAVTSSVYDPLGLISPLILPAKLLLQDLCRKRLGWDDEIPSEMQAKWHKWIDSLSEIAALQVKRHFNIDHESSQVQLHIFCDASNVAYGAVAYLRVSSQDQVSSSILMGKARVRPLKAVTIPRLELTAATLAVQLGASLSRELSDQPSKIVYHTDSTSVLYFLRNQWKRFPVFIANRIQTILDFS